MDLYEILLQRLVLLTDEYLQLKERVKELENETRIKNSTAPRIIKMKIEKYKQHFRRPNQASSLVKEVGKGSFRAALSLLHSHQQIDDTLSANSGNLSMVDNMTIISDFLLYIKPAKSSIFSIWNPCLINFVLHTKFF